MPLQPYSPLARFIGASWRLQLICAVVLLTVAAANPLWEIRQLLQQQDQTALANQQQQMALQQKQQVIALLNQKANEMKKTLDPQLAAQISPLNQRIQSAVSAQAGLHIRRQAWRFSAMPQLQLELEGRFSAIQRFLRQLQPHFAELSLLTLELSHADTQRSTLAHLTLQLTEAKHDEEK
ncbi:hypothetical protein ACWA5Z_07010 [Testudinibacter sp. P80/BLE/0925]|uniref:hypothetical protein n=1 Tax=Testudinibacter sp. TW-1 TaxID=3417757 RepID=UPI003D36FD5C